MVLRTAATANEWETLASAAFVPVRVEASDAGLPAELDHRGEREWGVSAIRGGAGSIARTPELITSSRDDIALFSLQIRGAGRVEQHGRHAHIPAGDGVLYLSRDPYTLGFPDRIELAILQVTVDALGVGPDVLSESTARPFRVRQDTALRTLARVMRSMFTERPVIENQTDALRTATELLGSVLRQRRTLSARSLSHSTLFAAFDRVISERLDDPGLDVSVLAAMEGVSVRTVHHVFAERSTTPAAYIRDARMHRARLLLTRTNLRLVDIALRCGGSDPSVFTRTFRRETGMTPTEYRRQTHDALGDLPAVARE